MVHDFLNILVASIVLAVFIVIVGKYIITNYSDKFRKYYTEAFASLEDESEEKPEEKSVEKSVEKSEEKPVEKPVETSIDTDYATMNSTNMTELYEKVNKQTDIIRTLKVPYSETSKQVKYNVMASNADEVNMTIFTNTTADG